MKTVYAGVVAALLLTLACAPAAPASRTGGPATESGTVAPRPDSGSWDETLAAARREGALVLSVTTGQLWRDLLTTFTQDYPEIRLELTGQLAGDFWPRLRQERAAGQYVWDLRVAGFGTDGFHERDAGTLDPIRPRLRPDIADDSKWLGGLEALFVDKDKQYMPGYLANLQSNIAINRELIPPAELSSGKDLADPRWKGKIVMQDPRNSGAGNAMLAVLLGAYGEPFVRDLLSRQDVVAAGDHRQIAEWVIRGRYPIGVGLSNERLLPFKEQGLGQHVVQLAEPLNVSSGTGGLLLINRAPHPNAATVFVNWLLSRDVQARIAPAVAYNSRRLDVSPTDPATAANPARLQEYIHDQDEQTIPLKERALALAKELVP
jgi:iron(III) transport system substrate-binding protein